MIIFLLAEYAHDDACSPNACRPRPCSAVATSVCPSSLSADDNTKRHHHFCGSVDVRCERNADVRRVWGGRREGAREDKGFKVFTFSSFFFIFSILFFTFLFIYLYFTILLFLHFNFMN